MLVLVDQFPFEENTIKMKNTLRWRFYYTALYYGSEAFARDLGVSHVPFVHQTDYLREAQRILASSNYMTMCSGRENKPSEDYRWALEEFVNQRKDFSSGNTDGGGDGAVAIPAPRK